MATPRNLEDIIQAHNAGDTAATSELLERLYAELHRIATGHMRRESRQHTLQATALVSEAYLRLFRTGNIPINDKDHFLNLASTTMREILIDHARRKQTRKRGGGAIHVTLDDSWLVAADSPLDWAAFGNAMKELRALSERQVRVIDLRYFAGFTVEQTAAVLGVSDKTIKNETQTAKAWICRRLAT